MTSILTYQNTLEFDPPWLDYTTTTANTLLFDVTNALTSLQATVATDPTAVLVDLAFPNDIITQSESPSVVAGTTIQHLLEGSLLIPKHRYRLTIGFTCEQTTNTPQLYITVNCLF